MSRRRRTSSVVLVVASVLGGCGGISADEYRSRMDRACATLQTETAQLPARQREEHLTLDEAQKVATRASDEFLSTVRSLDPPGDLEDAHERLVRVLTTPPRLTGDTTADLRRRSEAVRDEFAAVGAIGCKEASQRQIDLLEAS